MREHQTRTSRDHNINPSDRYILSTTQAFPAPPRNRFRIDLHTSSFDNDIMTIPQFLLTVIRRSFVAPVLIPIRTTRDHNLGVELKSASVVRSACAVSI